MNLEWGLRITPATIFHYGEYSIAQTKHELAAAGLPVRLGEQPE